MRQYDLAILSGTTRLPIATNRATNVTCSTGPRGFQDFTAFIPMGDVQADHLVQTPLLRVQLSYGGVLWEGRVEDLTLRNGGVEIGALGDARALDDVSYTALWSDARTAEWIPITEDEISNRVPSRYAMDTNNRIFIGLQKNTNYVGALGAMVYKWPYAGVAGTREITTFVFTYAFLASADFTARINSYDEGFAAPAVEWSLVGNGALQTATVTLALASSKQYVVAEINNTGVTYAGETGAHYFKLTSIRVKSSAASAITALAIVQHIRDVVNTVNPAALATSNRLMVETNLDLQNAVWQDARPSAILDELAALGDSTGQKYEWGVSEGQELYFRPLGSAARQWAIDASDLEVEQGLDSLYNASYATYEDANGRTLRTAASTDATSISRYGITRQAQVAADTASASVAATIAATATAATATPTPRSKVAVRRFSTLTGAVARPEEARAGDTVTIRNLPPTTSTLIDRVRTFTIAQTSFNLDTGDVEIVPESTTPDLDYQIAFILRTMQR